MEQIWPRKLASAANSEVAPEGALGLGYGIAGGGNRLPSMEDMAVGAVVVFLGFAGRRQDMGLHVGGMLW